MPLPLQLTKDDVYARFDGDPITRSDAAIESALKDALVRLKGACPKVKAMLSGAIPVDEDYLDLIKTVVLDAAIRYLRDDRSGLKSEEESAYNYVKDLTAVSSNIWFLANELEYLGCKKRSKIGTLTLGTDRRMLAPVSNGWARPVPTPRRGW
jgi:methionine salvage enolase-phosphatase E1